MSLFSVYLRSRLSACSRRRREIAGGTSLFRSYPFGGERPSATGKEALSSPWPDKFLKTLQVFREVSFAIIFILFADASILISSRSFLHSAAGSVVPGWKSGQSLLTPAPGIPGFGGFRQKAGKPYSAGFCQNR